MDNKVDNPDHDIVYVDEHGRCWTHMGNQQFEEIDPATLELTPALIVRPGENYVDGAPKGLYGPCRIKNKIILPKPNIKLWL